MNAILSHVLAVAFGFGLALVGFVVLNIKKPAQLDAAEGKIREGADKVKSLRK